jgi:hypothetical protein
LVIVDLILGPWQKSKGAKSEGRPANKEDVMDVMDAMDTMDPASLKKLRRAGEMDKRRNIE